jgi:hypothetical protein
LFCCCHLLQRVWVMPISSPEFSHFYSSRHCPQHGLGTVTRPSRKWNRKMNIVSCDVCPFQMLLNNWLINLVTLCSVASKNTRCISI